MKTTPNISYNTIAKLASNGDAALLIYLGIAVLPYAIEGISKIAHDAMEHDYRIKLKIGDFEFGLDH